MSDLSGVTMSERELLGHAFNFQWAAERAQRVGELAADDAGEHAAAQAGPHVTLPIERIIQVLIPADAVLRVRIRRIDGFSDRPAAREQRIVALDSAELFDLLTYEDVTLTLPRATDLADDEVDYTELVLDGAIVTPAMTRVYDRGLHILAAWWQSTIGAASSRMSTPPAALPAGMAEAPATGRGAQRVWATGGDALMALIWALCYDLVDAGQRVSPAPVMAQLKGRAVDPDARRKGPFLSSVAGGVKWEDSSGNEHELTAAALGERIGTWRKAVANG